MIFLMVSCTKHISHQTRRFGFTSGRFAHSSASASTTWSGFLSGELNDLVSKTVWGKRFLMKLLITSSSKTHNQLGHNRSFAAGQVLRTCLCQGRYEY